MSFICFDCPRRCGVERDPEKGGGVCVSRALPCISRAAPHFGEEPCITGKNGSGAIFFNGCNLRCVFCQNREISRSETLGQTVTVEELQKIMLSLQDQGVHNINLVTPTHFSRAIAEALSGIKLDIPVVWNSSGYESVETLRMLDGLVQVYMPDMKYMDKALAKRYSAAEDYPEVAAAAIKEMYRQRGNYILDEAGMLKSGVLIRHLILPGQVGNTMDVIDFAAESFPKNSVLFSLMSQYTPMLWLKERFPELMERVDSETNRHMYSYMLKCGIENGFWQDISAATDEMIPDFDLTGVKKE